MHEDPLIIYLSPRDVVLSRGVRRLVGKSVEVLKIQVSPSVLARLAQVPVGLVWVNPSFSSVPTRLVRVSQF
jgi:hypothetical protein